VTQSVPDSDAFSILLVCTGNICRSAMAERLGRALLEQLLGSRKQRVRLHSAGTEAVVGSAMHPGSALVLQGFGGDPEGFEARQLRADLVEDSHLVLTMTRAHRRKVLETAPRALTRTFTLREAAELLALVRDDRADEGARQSAHELVRDLSTARPRRRAGTDDDVPDPVGRPLEAHQEAGDLIAQALIPLLGLIAACASDGGTAPSPVLVPVTAAPRQAT
jgi:protein-tyrosine phosphatase